ncbi:hypothetical protein V1512DRAFT_201613 [Lipomyces arxii]|uniref:uncharacterized protein n=1 Tax=Lipomyces arxii TaxID=56418 RepID=UPI0034CDD2B6
MSETEIKLPWDLLYPITISELLVKEGSDIQKNTQLLEYRYPGHVTETRDLNEEVEVEKEFLAVFDSPVEGALSQWIIKKGQVIEKAGEVVALIAEPCSHEIQFSGLCALCGKDLTFRDYSGYEESDRANVAMFHNTQGLAVSMDEAERLEKTSTLVLLEARKLILVVDLDQTVIHTTVDPLIGEWKNNPEDPHHEAVKDVVSFTLKDRSNPRGYWYYVKVRPGLSEFLERISQIYELHIYTMATKTYAQAISKIIDPEGKYFGDRVLTRDESGNLEQKNLQRLFPVHTSLVTIIDDRGDVWQWSDNLIKVIPYEFFVGIGDINSSFLPKRIDVTAAGSTSGGTVTVTPDAEIDTLSDAGDSVSGDDKELQNLEKVLVAVHSKYYSEYDVTKANVRTVNVRKRKRASDWQQGLPDIKVIMPKMKHAVLDGVTLLFSGTIPLGVKPEKVDVVIWARSFGATVVDEFSTDVTHVVAERAGTKKVHQAARHPKIKIVTPVWLYRCLSTWKRIPEEEYLLDVSRPSEFDGVIDKPKTSKPGNGAEDVVDDDVDNNNEDDDDDDDDGDDGDDDDDDEEFGDDYEPVVRSLLVDVSKIRDQDTADESEQLGEPVLEEASEPAPIL